MNQHKVELFGHLLKAAFPGDEVQYTEEFDRTSWFYRIAAGAGAGLRHRVRVSREFLDDNDETEIRRKFRDWDLADRIRRAGPGFLLITTSGVKTLGDDAESRR